jgi:nicotinamide phosphoribosyltransferase
MNNNIILKVDSYKTLHDRIYKKGTEFVYSYLEARKGAKFDNTVFFGLQAILKKHFVGQVVTKEKIDQAEKFINKHIGPKAFNRSNWEYILEKHNGKLPIIIKAVAEGTSVPINNVLMTIENTDPNCYWLTNYIETILLQVWYPTTVATLSRENKKIINKSLEETGDVSGLSFKLCDFGKRGVSSLETAGFGGAAHLVNFMGTDNIEGIIFAQEYYNTDDMLGFSIPASEHSTITSWGKEGESSAMANMLEEFKDFPLIACVSDSWDIYNACEKLWGEELKDKVMNYNGTLVIRPDSGKPTEVLPRIMNILGEKFGFTVNDKGFKVLNKVRVIQGDGIEWETIPKIIKSITETGWSMDNLTLGSGGGLLQKLNRDTQKFAIKCSEAIIDGKKVEVFKDPVTDPGKQSKKGRLHLVKRNNEFVTTNVLLEDEKDYWFHCGR